MNYIITKEELVTLWNYLEDIKCTNRLNFETFATINSCEDILQKIKQRNKNGTTN